MLSGLSSLSINHQKSCTLASSIRARCLMLAGAEFVLVEGIESQCLKEWASKGAVDEKDTLAGVLEDKAWVFRQIRSRQS